MGIHVSEEKEWIVKENRKILYVCTFRGYEKIREVDNGSNQKIQISPIMVCYLDFFRFQPI